jgi:protein-S-isoprenylcysteine O-methyltransferase Ste14
MMTQSGVRAGQVAALVYGVVAYVLAVRSLVYLVFFLQNRWVARTVDGPPTAAPWVAAAIDLALLLGFALPHSLLARPPIKRWLARWTPAALERSTYAVVSGLSLAVFLRFWRPLPLPLWQVGPGLTAQALEVAGWGGWLLALAGLRSLDHWSIFGLEPAWRVFRGQPQTPRTLRTAGLRSVLRHPVYLGFLVALLATPAMTQGRALIALVWGGYVLIGVRFEERELVRTFGGEYEVYRKRVRSWLP